MQANENATLKEIREAFPVEQCAPHYKDTYKYLFYTNDKIRSALENNETDKTYFEVRLEEDENITKKYLTWDFYGDGKHFLHVKNGDKEEEVLSIKYWTKDAFEKHLVEHAKRYGISVEPQ